MLRPFDVATIRKDFPCLSQEVYGRPLIYLDSAATSQTPNAVLQEMDAYYLRFRGNVNRGAHYLSEQATAKYNAARTRVAKFIGATPEEVVFTRGTTESLNLVASTVCRTLKPDDEIILSEMEHHANIVPWYLAAKERHLKIRVIPVNDDGTLCFERFLTLFNEKTRVLGISHVSNAVGTINPIAQMIEVAKSRGVITVVDGAQAIPHLRVDVNTIGCDFYAFSGHKAYGPTGIGVVYGRGDWFDKLSPYQGGGDMIERVSFDEVTFARPPQKFEAGTPNIAGAIGLAAALDYLEQLDLEAIHTYERILLNYALDGLAKRPYVHVFGSPKERVSLLSFGWRACTLMT